MRNSANERCPCVSISCLTLLGAFASCASSAGLATSTRPVVRAVKKRQSLTDHVSIYALQLAPDMGLQPKYMYWRHVTEPVTLAMYEHGQLYT
jgi:hypothetical protein